MADAADASAVTSSPARRSHRRGSTGSVVATPSRHLDFRGGSQDDDDDDDDETQTAHRPRQRQRMSDRGARVTFSQIVEQEPARADLRSRRDRAWSDDDVYDTAASQTRGSQSPRGTPARRRKVVHWTKREEQFIIQGVKTHGLGQWRRILDEGHGVFHSHRTNGDIKDKWKNLVRKVALTPHQEEIADTRVWRETVAVRSIERMLPSLRQRAAEAEDDGSDAIDGDSDEQDGGDANTPSRSAKRRRLSQQHDSADALKFYIGTDASAPHLRAVTISPRECPTISTLKRVLARQLLDDSPLPTNLLLVSMHTRRLLGDLESVEECAERDGHELYLLYDP